MFNHKCRFQLAMFHLRRKRCDIESIMDRKHQGFQPRKRSLRGLDYLKGFQEISSPKRYINDFSTELAASHVLSDVKIQSKLQVS